MPSIPEPGGYAPESYRVGRTGVRQPMSTMCRLPTTSYRLSSIFLGLDCSRLAMLTVSTPPASSASTRSASAVSGSVNERAKVP